MKQLFTAALRKRSQNTPDINAVGGAVYRIHHGQPQLLLIKKRGGYWTLPKGTLRPGEGQADGAVREVKEETGLCCEVELPIREVSYTVYKRGQPRNKVVSYYLLRAVKGRLRPDKKEQIERVKWFTIPNALRRIKRGRVRSIAMAAGHLLEEPISDDSGVEAG